MSPPHVKSHLSKGDIFMKVTFIGNHNTPDSIYPSLYSTIENLIENGADDFYVGHNGRFDALVHKALKSLQYVYPHIRFAIVLTSPDKATPDMPSVFPEEMTRAMPRFAIVKRSRYMVNLCDCVVAYAANPYGNTAKLCEYAKQKGKRISFL